MALRSSPTIRQRRLASELERLCEAAGHLDRVRHGEHRDYLYAWYRYSTSWHLAHQWQALRERAAAARSRTNNWAVRPALVEIREQILTLPAPNVPPAPHWGADLPAATPPDDLDVWTGPAKAWNTHVPTGQKVRIGQPPAFGQFLETALSDQGLTDILNWIEHAIEDGYGLLLHW
ncbi:hypothetical protein ACRYCC_27520 [Actinomadura scrupuli]|uniref:hypothetical protein n=1 Tax=Actinomadura scrupuli TaxID=559629 RepID=UPI003D99BD4D